MVNKIRYRWFYTSKSKLVLAGKNAQQNEQLISKTKKKEIILHTKAPGSPFCVLKGKACVQDIKEAAIFCVCFSQGWKKKKKEMEVHIFRGEQISKELGQKTGTFSVIGKVQKGFVKLELWLGIQKRKLRAAPKSCFKKPLIKIVPGKMSKEKTIDKIHNILKKRFSKEEIAQAIPAGGFKL